MRLFYSFLFLLNLCIQAQEIPPIQNFSPATYNGGNQNWSIAQADDKVMYFANNDGLLEFNGAVWTLYPSPNETIIRSVEIIEDKIYTGAYMEFGYWEKTNTGKLQYSSISDQLELAQVEDEEFWNIIQVEQWILFQSLKRIYIYHPEDGRVKIIDSPEIITKVFTTKSNKVLFQRINGGLFEVVNGKDSLVLDNRILKKDEVIYIVDDGAKLVLLTKNNGFFTYSNGIFTKLETALDQYQDLEMYSAAPLSDGRIAVGSISQGVFILDQEFKRTDVINQQSGLLNNTVLSLFEDLDQNLWVGLDNGITKIELAAPITVFEDQDGQLGSVYATAVYKEKLYLGTNQGLYYKPLSSVSSKFEFVKSTEGQVWNLNVFDDKLWIAHHDGTFYVQDDRLFEIENASGTWNIKPVRKGLLLQGNYDGIYILAKSGDEWRIRNKVKGFTNSSRYFEIQDSTILVNHEYKGVFTLSLDSRLTKLKSSSIDTTLKGANSALAQFNGHTLYLSKKGMFKFEGLTKGFVKDSLLSSHLKPEGYISGRMVTPKQEELWVFREQEIVKVSSGTLSNVPTIEKIPLHASQRRNIIEYENIIPFQEPSIYLIGTSFGYLVLDTDKIKINDFQVYISNLRTGIDNNHHNSQLYTDLTKKGTFETGNNNLTIHFHSPDYSKYFSPSYQHQLIGEYNQWSEWTKQPKVFYENIPPGNYTFNVRAKVGNQVSSNIASYQFTIPKPWYARDFMIAIYILCVAAFSLFMHNVYRVYYKKQQFKIIEQNKKEIELEKLKSEQEMIRYKNEQLERENKDKSNELAASTMSIN